MLYKKMHEYEEKGSWVIKNKSYIDVNLGGQGMVITNQGVAIKPVFSRQNICNFIKQANRLCL